MTGAARLSRRLNPSRKIRPHSDSMIADALRCPLHLRNPDLNTPLRTHERPNAQALAALKECGVARHLSGPIVSRKWSEPAGGTESPGVARHCEWQNVIAIASSCYCSRRPMPPMSLWVPPVIEPEICDLGSYAPYASYAIGVGTRSQRASAQRELAALAERR